MAEKSIKLTITSTKPNRINISASKEENHITTSGDTSYYNSQLAKNWAIGEGLIQNEDYSSKTYAKRAEESATAAGNYAAEAQATSDNFINVANGAMVEIGDAKQESLTEISIAHNSAMTAISSEQANALTEIGDLKNSSITSLDDIKTSSLNEIQTEYNNSIAGINEVKNASVSEITSLSGDYIDSINATGKGYNNLTHRQITNCLLEVPQRIKLELNNGVLTLKAGSVVIVPNGFEADGTTPKFDYVTVESDWVKAHISNANSADMVWLPFGVDSVIYSMPPLVCLSGNTQPVNTENWQYILWYDTQNNDVKFTRDYGSTWYGGQSLPLGLVNSDSTKYTSINQVFNGMGHIGSTIWIDKDVKGLSPNGRNEDGTLRNIEHTRTSIGLLTAGHTDAFNIVIDLSKDNGLFLPACSSIGKNRYYDIESNYWYVGATDGVGGEKAQWCVLGTATTDANKNVISFNPKQPFRAIDYSDKSEVSGWGIPSNKYIDLTLGASGSTYIAPANGWFNSVQNLSAGSDTNWNNGVVQIGQRGSDGTARILVPVKKGDSYRFYYTGLNQTYQFRFIYAVGSESEAQ